MFAKLATVAFLAAAISVQALPQGSGEHTCNQECLAAASAHGLPPLGCAADDYSCLGCGAPGFVQAMTECLQQSCHETVTLTCATAAVRRQEPSGTSSVAAPGASSASQSETASASEVTESSSSASIDASGSGTLVPSSTPVTGSTVSVTGSGAPSVSASSTSGSVHTTVGTQSGAAGASGSLQTATITNSNSAPGSQNTNGGNGNGSGGNNSAAMGISIPLNSVVGAGAAVFAVLAGSGLVL
ncbi:hypothetical protein BDY19DRAFT_992258 [Irpex rosettiformis]|uniref:Uncharacterized protein n=1 Tax=Irpex rosettiformis TaxID=378272 RepID=A0ACB8U9B1_9APHY|nr:hypothetical protein BDY19DRAFT_992258 [Irpex rosettiformis]